MGSTRNIAGQGLYYLFVGQMVSLFAFIPILGIIALLAGSVISLYGFYTLSKSTAGYKAAFTLTLLNMAAGLLGVFLNKGISGFVFDAAATLLGFCVVFLVCSNTADLLSSIDSNLKKRAGLIWKLYALCTLVVIVCQLLMFVPFINVLAGIVTIIIAIVQVVVSVLYMIFLWQSQKVLKACS